MPSSGLGFGGPWLVAAARFWIAANGFWFAEPCLGPADRIPTHAFRPTVLSTRAAWLSNANGLGLAITWLGPANEDVGETGDPFVLRSRREL